MWTEEFDGLVRTKLLDAIKLGTNDFIKIQDQVHAFVHLNAHDNREVTDLYSLLFMSDGDAYDVLDSLDALSVVLGEREAEATVTRVREQIRQAREKVENPARVPNTFSAIDFGGRLPESVWYNTEAFRTEANRILFEHRVAFKYVNGRLVEREHEELHAEIIQPLEKVLTDNPKFAKAQVAYRQAMISLASGNSGAAVVSAGGALEEALKALGAKGNDLNTLMKDAVYRKFLSGHDEKLKEAFRAITDWVNADRGNKGIAHGAADSARDDAWLAVHIAGALIVRLAGEEPRGATK